MSPYIFTINILFPIVDPLRVQENIVLAGGGGGGCGWEWLWGSWWTPLAHGL